MIKLFIFDLDGVIASTSIEHFTAWKLVMKKRFKFDVADSVEELTKGVSRMDSLERILESYDLENKISLQEKEELAHLKNELYKELISKFDENSLFEGVVELFEFLKRNKILIALGSASKNGPALIEGMKIGKYFDYVVNPEGLNSKPHPDIFMKAMNHFNLTPLECIGVEDAIAGVASIKKAGMLAIGIGSKKELKQADYVFDSVSKINYDFLEELIGIKNGKH